MSSVVVLSGAPSWVRLSLFEETGEIIRNDGTVTVEYPTAQIGRNHLQGLIHN